jgi:integrase
MKHIDKNRIKSSVEAEDTNIPYTDDDLQTVMEHLDAHDPFVAFFCRFVFYTLLRPREICGLRVKDIDLVRNQITVPLAIAKTRKKRNPKPEIIDIVPQFLPLIRNLNLHQYPHDYYVVSADETKTVGTKWLDPEKPYKRLVNQHLKTLGLQDKGYTLYGFKHTSNILRFKSRKWELDDIMKANRHADLQTTMKYLKDITRTTDIANKDVPII